MNPPEKKRLTPAEVEAREKRLRAAGLTPRREKASVITLLAKRAPVEEPREQDDGSGRGSGF